MNSDDEHHISERVGKIEKFLKDEVGPMKEAVMGRPGRPQESLIVKVDNLAKDMKVIKATLVFIATSGGAMILKTIWDLIQHAN